MAEVATLGLKVDGVGNIDSASKSLDRFTKSGRTAEQSTGAVTRESQRSSKSLADVARESDRASSGFDRLSSAARTAIGVIGTYLGTREIIAYADAWKNAENQLRIVTKSTDQLADVQQRLVDTAVETRSNFSATANLYARLARSTTELGLSQSDLIGLTTTINQSFAVSGATAEEASAAITQLSQGLASGALRGDEFNSVAEQAPGILRAVADSLNMGIGELRAFAATGGITAEIVVNALQGASDTIARDFAGSIATFGQQMEVARTNLTQWIGTSDEVRGALSVLGESVVFLSDNLDAMVKAGQVAAALYAGRFVSGMVAATTSMSGAVTVAGVLRGAMMALGGPLGLLIGAGGLMYTFREELGLVRRAAEPTTQRIDNLTDAINRNSVAAVEAGVVNLAAEYFTLGQRAASATAEIERLTAAQENDRQGAQARLQNNMRLRDLREDLAQIVTEQEAAGNAANELRQILNGLGETVVETTDSTTDLNDTTDDTAAAASGASKEVTTLADAYESLLDRITPNRREAKQYARDLGTLNLALASGRMNTQQYMQAMGMLQESFQSSQRDTTDIAEVTDVASDEMARAWEEAAKRIDETFADAFVGAFDSFESFADQLMSGFKRLLGELAYAAAKNQIMVSFGLDGSGQGQLGGQQGGMSLQSINPGMLQNGWDTVSGWWGGGSQVAGLGVEGGVSSTAIQSANQVAAGSSSGWMGGSMQNYQGMGAVYNMGASMAGGYVGGEVGSSVTGKTANSNYGETAGSLIGSYWGPWGAAAGSAIGSFVDSLFGSNKKTFDFDFQQGGNYGVFGDRSSELGDFGLTALSDYKLGEQQDALKELLTSVAEFDNQLAASAIPERVEAMRASIEGFAHSGAEDLFDTRLRTIISGSGAYIADAIAAIADPEVMAEAFVSILNFERVVSTLNEQIQRDIIDHLEANTGDIQGTIAGLTQALDATVLLGNSVERLNLQFDTAAEGAIHSAWALQEAAGGVENMAAIHSAYYQAAFSETERLSNAQQDLAASLSGVTDNIPHTIDELRSLVEAQDLNTDAGGRLAYELMSLAPALRDTSTAVRDAIEAQYQSALGREAEAEGLEYWFNKVSSGSVTLNDALQLIANSAEAAALPAQDLSESLSDLYKDVSDSIQSEKNLLRTQLTAEENRIRGLMANAERAFNEAKDLMDVQRSQFEATYNASQNLLKEEMSRIEDQYGEASELLRNRLSIANESLSAITSTVNALERAIQSVRLESNELEVQRRNFAQATLSGYLDDARQGVFATGAQINDAVSSLSPSTDTFASAFDYQQSTLTSANILKSLYDLSEEQMTEDQMMVDNLDKQLVAMELNHNENLKSLQRQYDANQEYYDEYISQWTKDRNQAEAHHRLTIDKWQEQIDVNKEQFDNQIAYLSSFEQELSEQVSIANGTYRATLSVAEAVDNLRIALGEEDVGSNLSNYSMPTLSIPEKQPATLKISSSGRGGKSQDADTLNGILDEMKHLVAGNAQIAKNTKKISDIENRLWRESLVDNEG